MQNNLVYICSPYRGEVERNVVYARQLTRTAIDNSFVPITPHLYLTQVLTEENPLERRKGMAAGLELLKICKYILVGTKYGVSSGMKEEIWEAKKAGTVFLYSDGGKVMLTSKMIQEDPCWWFGAEKGPGEDGKREDSGKAKEN